MCWFVSVLAALLVIPAAIGMLVLFHTIRQQRAPADTSNRINKIRLIWFAITREELFADHFEWLKGDEYENIR